ncbi:MAG: cellulase family glycosylhydrolase [Thermoleophilaceae bacterium]
MVQDDSELLYASPKRVSAALDLLRRAGVRTVRLTAGWSVLAPRPRAATRPRFEAEDPAAYRAAGWRRIDRAVRGARRRGMAVMIDIAFWAPVWATSRDTSEHPREAVDPILLARFAKAVARRYDGAYDPPGRERPLPAVRGFTIWNEPNLPDFLGPQWRDPPTRRVPLSPHRYRAMVAAAYPAVKAVQPNALVLVGGLAAYGRGGVAPLHFLRELACVDDRLRPLQRAECHGFARVPGDGLAYHPYSTRTLPDRAEDSAGSDDAPLARLGGLASLLDELAADGRIDPSLRDIYLTEYGYETNPPDPGAPFGPERAARMSSWAEAIASREQRVRTVAQFLVRDLPSGPGAQREGRLSDWQSGVLFLDGSPKPLALALAAPLHAELGARGQVRVWARVRPGEGRRAVRIETVEPGGRWLVAFEGETDERGVIARTVPGGNSTLLRSSRRAGGRWLTGPVVDVVAPGA